MTAEMKKKVSMLGIVAAVVITVGVTAYIVLTAGVFAANQEQAIVNQVWGGKAPTAAEEKKIVDQVWNNNQFAPTAPVSAPVVVPPSARSDFKAEYRITGPAAKEIEFKFIAPDRSDVVTYEAVTKTDKPLQITRSLEYRDASGKIIYSTISDWGIIQGKTGEMIRGGNTETKTDEGANKLLILFEVRYAN